MDHVEEIQISDEYNQEKEQESEDSEKSKTLEKQMEICEASKLHP